MVVIMACKVKEEHYSIPLAAVGNSFNSGYSLATGAHFPKLILNTLPKKELLSAWSAAIKVLLSLSALPMTQSAFRLVKERASLMAFQTLHWLSQGESWIKLFLVLTLAPPSARRIPHWILLWEAVRWRAVLPLTAVCIPRLAPAKMSFFTASP